MLYKLALCREGVGGLQSSNLYSVRAQSSLLFFVCLLKCLVLITVPKDLCRPGSSLVFKKVQNIQESSGIPQVTENEVKSEQLYYAS